MLKTLMLVGTDNTPDLNVSSIDIEQLVYILSGATAILFLVILIGFVCFRESIKELREELKELRKKGKESDK